MQPQSRYLIGPQLEHEVEGEAVQVARNLLVQTLGGLSIQLGQILIEHHQLATDLQDTLRELTLGEMKPLSVAGKAIRAVTSVT